MPIRLKPIDSTRVEIHPTFINAMAEMREQHVVQLRAQIHGAEEILRESGLSRWERAAQQKAVSDLTIELQMMQRNEGGLMGGRAGLDYEITRLHKLPYLSLTTLDRTSYNGVKQSWLIGRTAKLISRPIYRKKVLQNPAEHGPYLVCVERSSLGEYSIVWRLLDMTDLQNLQPHLHARIDYYPDDDKPPNPIDWEQRTCWAEFGGIIQSLWLSADIPGIFQILHQFVSSLNLDSPMGTGVVERWKTPGTDAEWEWR